MHRVTPVASLMHKTQIMKKIILYQCEICGKIHEQEIDAKECEMKGEFDSSKYPVGLMFEYYHHGYVGIFAIPEKIQFWNNRINHLGHTGYWACRKNYGDSLGDQQCGGDFFKSDDESLKGWIKHHIVSPKHVNGDEFNRMVKFLKSQGITPSYYNKIGTLITLS